jgi:hypothetical protein
MAHYIVYQNRERMGSYLGKGNPSSYCVTNKCSRCKEGDTVWFIQGLGKPRRYFLEGNFVVNKIEQGQFEGFRYRMSGPGKDFDTQATLNNLPWFPHFLKRMPILTWVSRSSTIKLLSDSRR